MMTGLSYRGMVDLKPITLLTRGEARKIFYLVIQATKSHSQKDRKQFAGSRADSRQVERARTLSDSVPILPTVGFL